LRPHLREETTATKRQRVANIQKRGILLQYREYAMMRMNGRSERGHVNVDESMRVIEKVSFTHDSIAPAAPVVVAVLTQTSEDRRSRQFRSLCLAKSLAGVHLQD
jgi:hypothetical protein